MPTTEIITGWLKDENGEKIAPKTLTSQVQTSDGTLIENKIASDIQDAISKIPTPDVSGQIGNHNSSGTAHSDIRTLISNAQTAIQTTQEIAESASSQAQTAQAMASGAQGTAETATGRANEAYGLAQNAQNAASDALTRAGYAQNDAIAALQKAGEKVAKTGDTMTGSLKIYKDNPYVEFKDNAYDTIWYVQAYQDNISFGPTYAKAVKTDKSGNMSVPGTVTVEDKVKLDYDAANQCLNFVFI